MDTSSINLLIFPLIGGYYIVTRLERLAFINQRLSDQAILFNSILVGIPLLVVSLAITATLGYFFAPQIASIKNFLPIRNQYIGTCILSFVIAVGGTALLNRFIDESQAILTAVKRIGNELELLFAMSVQDSQLIQITLKNDKVYVGWVEIIPKPNHTQYVKLIPLFSGYRNERKELKINTDYSEVYSDYIRKGKIKNIQELEMNLVIRVDEILSASRFDFAVWEEFERNRVAELNVSSSES